MNDEEKLREYGMLFLNLITPLHNGSGEGLGIVDNPIMRERKTQFPVIQASSIKGVLRDAYREKISSRQISQDEFFSLFGPSPNNGHEHAGAISFGDGLILAFPVRSVKGCFVWITSPLVIWRFYQRVNFSGMNELFPNLKNIINLVKFPLQDAVICSTGEKEIMVQEVQSIFLEEFSISYSVNAIIEEVAKDISKIVYNSDCFLKNEFEKKLVLVDDDTFRYFTNNATEIVPNIRIGENGTTEKGSLRYTEFLPSETIMYSTLIFEKSRKNVDSLKHAKDVENKFKEIRPSYVQIGGDETTGKGIVQLSLAKIEDRKDSEEEKLIITLGDIETESSKLHDMEGEEVVN